MNAQEQKALLLQIARLSNAVKSHLRMPTNHTTTDLKRANMELERMAFERAQILAHVQRTQDQLSTAF